MKQILFIPNYIKNFFFLCVLDGKILGFKMRAD